MKINYCLPIIKDSKKEILKSLKFKGFNFYEVWLDYIKDLDKKFMLSLAKKFKGKIIFVFRRKNLEPTKLSIDKRRNLISLLSKFDVFLDLDFLTQHEELEFLKKSNSKVKRIVSYHNYRETPSLEKLEEIIREMKKFNPDIFKISTFSKNKEDSLKLLNLLLILKKQNKKFIILGMGKKGLITRIFGTLWRNEMIYAPKTITEQSAPGQLTREQLETIFTVLEK